MAEWPYSTARWQKLRTLKLQQTPLCEGCPAGAFTIASHVDHVRPISDGGDPFPPLDGLRAYCPPCHSAKTARGAEAGAVRSNKPRRGCDEHGNPLDAAHPWKSLKADDKGPPGNTKTQLVSKGNRNG
jgi:5-methylcytosine-specific restriction protein A